MGKFERVDRLMDQAAESSVSVPTVPPGVPVPHQEHLEQEHLEEKARPTASVDDTELETSHAAAELLAPRMSNAERTRQLFGVIRPFLPVVGGALRLIDHGAAQAASRLLPLLGGPAPAAAPSKPVEAAANANAVAALEKQYAALRADLDMYRDQIVSHEERLGKLREALSRTLAERDEMQVSLRKLSNRNRVLTVGLVVLLLLVVAGFILLEIPFRH